ncbi:SDR family oxidoreductase [Subsaximicrobium wynnwilliamsii]|uniref:SDR family oxidoreductase n=1 Tax=Subsaximicrobium wynnwilliamsii TaxID=291179 RepID=A0A5C6ZHH9_9FLAO|nr:SDR family oxidoreductase [Subsaximicrobium wynnwilliamsii]TXD82458.1 SDR family oxidoreductase [Subsaximicrobium wynnwilliamsii]TXD88100.1 SDR family oxidoreductase [Subsaximicrobium wynnwilliamsii]TXE02038.1 SDR family oxidoreductase [Subsaximicrobium wynnwilliamsii]
MQKPNQRLINQTCIVTGGSSGIGSAVAKAIASEGANVVINYNSSKASAEELAHEISKDKRAGDVITCQADVSQEQDVQRLFKTSKDQFKHIDICVSNAGIQKDSPLHAMRLADWNKVIGVNLTGQFLCARAALNEFMNTGIRKDVSRSAGKIIHMSSVHEVIPWAGHANYAASKGGIAMLMQSICQGYAQYKIRCNSIAPGAIKTPINKEVWQDEAKMKKLLKLIPYDEIGEPSEIGSVASWLASDESEYINGTTIYVDGGMTCYPGFTTNG